MKVSVIGTRGSPLAMWQADHVRRALLEAHPGLKVELQVIRTTGDVLPEPSLATIGGKGVFTKEIENALLKRDVDLAVHSLKDLPTQLAEGLRLAAVLAREDPADALVAREGRTLAQLPPGAKLLTGSLRRQAQLLHRRPDLKIAPMRGNVQTRLSKFDRSDASAMILARAGLARLGSALRACGVLVRGRLLSFLCVLFFRRLRVRLRRGLGGAVLRAVRIRRVRGRQQPQTAQRTHHQSCSHPIQPALRVATSMLSVVGVLL